MSVPSYPFHSLSLKLQDKRIDFPFPLLKLSNKGREEYSKMILFIHFHSIPFPPLKWKLFLILIQSRDSPKATLAPVYTFFMVHCKTQFRIVIIATKDFLMWAYVIKPNHINHCFHSLLHSIKHFFFLFILTALTWLQLIITIQTFFCGSK